MIDQCEFLDECPIFLRFHSKKSVSLWIKMYCQGPRINQCQRRRMKIEGFEVPITLLPNGKELVTLKNLP